MKKNIFVIADDEFADELSDYIDKHLTSDNLNCIQISDSYVNEKSIDDENVIVDNDLMFNISTEILDKIYSPAAVIIDDRFLIKAAKGIVIPDEIFKNNLVKNIRSMGDFPIVVSGFTPNQLRKASCYLNGATICTDENMSKQELINIVYNLISLYIPEIFKSKPNEEKFVIDFCDLKDNYMQKCIYLKGEKLILTSYEYEVLHYMINKNSCYIKKEELWDNIWVEKNKNKSKTVSDSSETDKLRAIDTIIKKLRKKIANSEAGIKTKYRVGYGLYKCDKHYNYYQNQEST